jgi:hypothetical protein
MNIENLQLLTKNPNELNENNIFGEAHKLQNEIDEIKKMITFLIDTISEEKMEKLLKNNEKNQNMWIDNEDNLIHCAEHLKKYKIIGVDLEYYRPNRDVNFNLF